MVVPFYRVLKLLCFVWDWLVAKLTKWGKGYYTPGYWSNIDGEEILIGKL